MSLDPMPDTATLLRMKAAREGTAKAPSRPVEPLSPRQATPTALTLTLPWSALQTGNRFFGLTSKAYRAAKARAAARIEEQLPAIFPVFPSGAVRVVVRLYMPNAHRRDLLNYAKLIADVLSSRAYRDDSQIHDAHFLRLEDVDSPRAVIHVMPLEADRAG